MRMAFSFPTLFAILSILAPASARTEFTVRGEYAFVRSDEKLIDGKICDATARRCIEASSVAENLLSADLSSRQLDPAIALVHVGGVQKAILVSQREPVKLESLYSALLGAVLALIGATVVKLLDEVLSKERLNKLNASRFRGVCVSIIDRLDKSSSDFEDLIRDAYQVAPEVYFENVRSIRRVCELRIANAVSAEDAIKEIETIMLKNRAGGRRGGRFI